MALFPSSPTNGQTTIVNGITYTYNSAQTAWIRTAAAPSGDFSVSGNITATGNISGVRLISNVATGTAPLTVSSTTVVANLNADLLDGFNTATANTANTVAVRDASGNLAANFFIGNGSQLTGIITSVSNVSNGNSNLNIPAANGNINLSVAGNANVLVVTGTGVNVAGTLNTGTGIITGNGSGLSAIAGANVTGTVSSATTAGTVTTAAQPNITSVSTSFSGLTFVANAQLSMSGAGSQIDGVNLISANFFSGNGSSITALNATNIASGTLAQARLANSNVILGSTTLALGTTTTTIAGLSSVTSTTFVGALTGAATTAGTVTTAAQPNITSVGVLTGLTVGNATANAVFGNGTITLNSGLITGNGNGLSSLQAANVTGTLPTSVTNAISNVGTITAGIWNSTFTAGLNANTLANIQGANVSGAVASATVATNASALLQNTSTATTVYPTFTTSSANGNSSAVINTGISANLGNSSITATTFVGALSGNATTAGTVVTAAQPNITSVGTLTSLGVTGNITAGNLLGPHANGNSNVNIPAANGNVNISAVGNANVLVVTGTGVNVAGTLNTGTGIITGNGSGLSAIAGANVTGTVSAATTAGTVTTAAQPNITSVGTLSGLSVTANVAAGNLTTTGVLSVTGTGVSSIAGNLDMTSNNIINLATPVNSTDAATKQYVDDVAQGLHTHDSCNAATQTTLATISGGTVTYNNGTSGVGATLTTTGSYTTIDGVTLTNGMRILVKDEANTAHNGIYDRTSSTVLTRSDDFNTPTEMAGGDFTFVTAGTLYDNTGWVMPDAVTTVGTSPVVWIQFSGAGTYTAGTGLTLTGSQFSVNASQTQITSVGTLGSLAVTANANVGNLNATTAVVASTLTSNVATGTAPLTVTSTTRVSNLNVAYANVADNINVASGTGNNFLIFANAATGNVAELTSTGLTANLSNNSITATTFVGALSGAATTAGTVTTAAQPNITSVGTLTGLTVGNATANAVFGNGTITLNSGLITGNGNGLSSLQAANVTGTLPTSVTNAISNVGTITAGIWNSTFTAGLNANTLANIQGANVSGAVASATAATNASALLQNTSTATTVYPTFSTSSANGNSSAVINTGISANLGNSSITATTFVGALSGAATSATTAGTVTTAAQPNITSVGTLTSLGVTGNANVGNLNATTAVIASTLTSNVATGTAPLTVTSTTRVANLNVDYANVADFISVAAGTGNNFLIFANAATGNITELTSTGLTANLSNNSITATTFVGALSGAATSATTAGTVTTAAQPNITSVGTLTSLGVTGTATAGNLTTAGILTVTGNTALSGANVSLGAVGNLRITGGTANQVLRSDGGGAVSWQTLPVTNIQEFTATAGQTTFTVSGTYLVGSVLVFVNGIQMNNVDYTATNGTTVVLTEARVAGDTVRVVSSVGSVGLNNMQAVSIAMSVALGM